MFITLIRAVIIYLLILGALRLMGKRQIGELQPAELIVTILLSELVAVPMQDNELPLLGSVIPVLVIVCFEVIGSVISLKSRRFRALEQGHPVIVIRNGVIDQREVKRLRFTVDELLSALRLKDVFDLAQVQYAVLETNGQLSVLLHAAQRTATPQSMQVQIDADSMPQLVISDGKLILSALRECGVSKKRLDGILRRERLAVKDVYILTLDKQENLRIVRKEGGV